MSAPTPHSVPPSLARRTLLARQALLDPPQRGRGRAHAAGIVERLGFVQLDSINTVARAQHMILFARCGAYRQADLGKLVEKDRRLFENWTHDAAAIPTAFFPYWRRHFLRSADALRAKWRRWRSDAFETEITEIRAIIEAQGAMRARDVARVEEAQHGGGWWDWKPSKVALEYLWRTGALAVARREGFEKVYDLAERVIPAEHWGAAAAEPDAFIDWCCRQAVERLGIATPSEIAGFWGLVSVDEAKDWAERGGAAYPRVVVAHDEGPRRVSLAAPDVLEAHPDDFAAPGRLRALSPFDPALRDRARAQRLFGFDYRIEVFVPAAQRRYGYYVFPLLEEDRLVGRIDMRRATPGAPLTVTGLWWEPGVRGGAQRRRKLEAELERVARFAACDGVVWAADAERRVAN